MGSLPSGLPDEIDDEEDLARFLTSSNHYSKSRMEVRPAAFLPNPSGDETSVSRHGREPSKQLWKIGASAAGERTLHGAAIFKARDVRLARLDVIADEPPLRHAAIRKWPSIENDPDEQRAQRKLRALELVSAAGEPLLRELS